MPFTLAGGRGQFFGMNILDFNNSEQAIGYESYVDRIALPPFCNTNTLYDASLGTTILGTSLCNSIPGIFPRSINDSGIVAGYNSQSRAALYNSQSAELTDIGSVYLDSESQDINNKKEVTGLFYKSGPPFLVENRAGIGQVFIIQIFLECWI